MSTIMMDDEELKALQDALDALPEFEIMKIKLFFPNSVDDYDYLPGGSIHSAVEDWLNTARERERKLLEQIRACREGHQY